MNWRLYIGHAVLLGSLLITVAVLLAFKILRKRRERRSPLHGKQIGHVPGQQLLDRVNKASDEVHLGAMFMVNALPMFFVIWAASQIDWSHVRIGVNALILLTSWALCFGYGFWHFQRHLVLLEQARDGLLAERVTGMQLNRLVAQGCLVLHDLPSDVGNIDHIVVAPQAIFAVETKSFRKPKGDGENHRVRYDGKSLHFPDFTNVAALEQAERSAQWVARYLRDKLNFAVPVVPALALPGWYIERMDSAKGASVRTFTPMGRGAEFMASPPERLTPEQRSLVAQTLALRYPESKGS